MSYKLKEYIEKYKEITIKQESAIDSDEIELLNKLTEAKQQIINEITKTMKVEKISLEINKEVKKIIDLENCNIVKLRNEQKKTRDQIDKMKKRQKGLDAYRTYK